MLITWVNDKSLDAEKAFDSCSILRWRKDWVREDRGKEGPMSLVTNNSVSSFSLSEKIQGCSAKKDVSLPGLYSPILSVYQV